MKAIRIIILVIALLFLIPVVSHILWRLEPSRKMGVLIVDKTVTDMERSSHLPFIWNLQHLRFIKNDGKPYKLYTDYFGFQPLKPFESRNYDIQRIRITEIDDLADRNNLLFYADTRGISYSEWILGSRGERKVSSVMIIIGGLNQNDYLLLKAMYEKNKTVIAEHQFFSSSSDPLILKKTADLFRLDYSGWHGKYFKRLDTLRNQELPQQFVASYKKQYNKPWSFRGHGIILAKGNSVVVLEQKDLLKPYPVLVTRTENAKAYLLPDSIGCTGWFEVTGTGLDDELFAEFCLPVSESGRKKLSEAMLPDKFPAILHISGGHNFWYFTGDFSNHRMPYWTRKLKAWENMQFLHASSPGSPSYFIWKYYMPLTKKILEDTYNNLQ